MLTEFSIGNYQAFSAPQRVPLKPITLIFGPNSAGKSALLRTLLLARQAILDETLTKNTGSHERHPGKPDEFIRDKHQPLRISFTTQSDGDGEDQRSDSHRVDLLWKANDAGNVKTHSMKVLRNHEEFLRFEQATETIKSIHPSLSQLFGREPKREAETTSLTAVFIHSEVLHECLKDNDAERYTSLTATAALPGSRIADFTPCFIENHGLWKQADCLQGGIQKIIRVVRDNLETALENMVYHGCIRPVPKRIRTTDAGNPMLSEWWQVTSDFDVRRRVNQWFARNPHTKRYLFSCDYLLPLSRLKNLVQEIGTEVTPDEAVEEAFRAKLNSDEEFRDKLVEDHLHAIWDDNDPSKCQYDSKEKALEESYWEILAEGWVRGWAHFDELYQSKGRNSALEFLLAGVSALKKNAAMNHPVPFEHVEEANIYFVDVATNTKIPPSNLGVGFSQMLPLVVSAFTCENQQIAIEQPELHVHPALQTELADLFIQSTKERGNRFLIETHSEHLILRILRRIRETTRNSLPEGKPAIKPEDVAILYVKPGENGSTVQELRIDEQGRFVDNWPQGFFEERLDEMF